MKQTAAVRLFLEDTLNAPVPCEQCFPEYQPPTCGTPVTFCIQAKNIQAGLFPRTRRDSAWTKRPNSLTPRSWL